MTDATSAPLQPNSAIPADDPNRKLTVADPDSSKVRHVAVVGGTYSIVVSGAQMLDRHDRARWRRAASTPPRFRGDVHGA